MGVDGMKNHKSILAGITYRIDGHTIEALRVPMADGRLCAEDLLIDGNEPAPGGIIPRWVLRFISPDGMPAQ